MKPNRVGFCFTLAWVLVSIAPVVATTDDTVGTADPSANSDRALSTKDIVEKWKKATAKIRTFETRFTYYAYDKVFRTQKVGQGSFCVEGRKKARIEKGPADTERVPISSRRISHSGKHYELRPVRGSTWILNGGQVMQINHELNAFETFKTTENGNWFLPRFDQLHRVLLLQFGLNPDQIEKRYTFEHIERNDGRLYLRGTLKDPEPESRSHELTQIEFLIDKRSFLPTAVKLIKDPDRSLESVYVLRETRVNQPITVATSPFEVDRAKYRPREIATNRDQKPNLPTAITKRQRVLFQFAARILCALVF